MANYISGRHKFARGSVTDEMCKKLVEMIKGSSGKEDLLAEDIIELIAVARNDKDGFRAANKQADVFLCDYQTEFSPLALKVIGYMRENNFKANHSLTAGKSFQFVFMASLNPKESDALEGALQELHDKGVLTDKLALTDAGFDTLY